MKISKVCKPLLAVFLLFLGLCSKTEAFKDNTPLQMYILKVGQASFVLATKEKNMLIVDCGFANDSYKSTHEEFLEWIIANMESIKIIISHNHADHKNQIENLKALSRLITNENILSAEPNRTKEKIDQFLVGTLGNEISFETLYPPNLDGTDLVHNTQNTIHNDNLIIKIIYQQKGILLTGDPSAALFKYFKKSDQLTNQFFNNICCMLHPHHGSNNNKENEWIKLWKQAYKSKKILFISSDPVGRDKIPAEDHLTNLRETIPNTLLTSEARGNYYKLVMHARPAENVEMELFDADQNISQQSDSQENSQVEE